jgi:tellurite methyltransferase
MKKPKKKIHQNNLFWENFYKKDTLIYKPSSFAKFIKKKFINKEIKTLLDIGCGNGRDTFYFSKYVKDIQSIDNSRQAIIQNKNNKRVKNNITFIKKNILNGLGDSVKKIVYARFFLHTINYRNEDIFLKILKKISNKTTIVALEFRTTKDQLLQKGVKISTNEGLTDHYRRFVDVGDFLKKLNKINFKIIYLKQSINLSKYKNDNPHLCRVVFKKC